MVPYNTGKVLVGSRYEVPPPRMPEMDRDATLIQSALLGRSRTPARVDAPLWFAIVCAAAALVIVYIK